MAQGYGPLWQLKENAKSKRLLVAAHIAGAERYTKLAERERLLADEYERAADLLEAALGEEYAQQPEQKREKGHGV